MSVAGKPRAIVPLYPGETPHLVDSEGLPFLFADRAQPPKPVFHHALPGLSDGDIGELLGLTKQRIQQIRSSANDESRQVS
ncbi:hypothetical protein ACFPOI_41140 [Nonomuraea angiospora]|uniref:RNA polymerase sigma-70 region 4 domain-containing protein n=1 Tax=Nonomuraea angiospora TaxID=46172 RepID=A0ABR9M3W1_9ACTN|nr:hypothetical protein [Nonomuraea angiospora]MBE1587600.1 hypothetical protein [Nonomuraea angiospora]